MKLPEAVFIDLDDTLYDYQTNHTWALDELFLKIERQLGVGVEVSQVTYEAARQEVKASLGETAASHNRLLYMHRMLELLGLKSQPLLALDFEQTYWRKILERSSLFPGALEFLQNLQRRKIPTVIITDLTSQIQFRKIIYLGIDQYIDFVVTSEEAGAEKPNEKPFKLALSKIGSNPNELWMVGDNYGKDIVGAKQALGAVTFLKRQTKVESEYPLADVKFQCFNELNDYFK